MAKRKKKKFPYFLLMVLIAVSLGAGWYLVFAPEKKSHHKVWTAPVHVKEKPIDALVAESEPSIDPDQPPPLELSTEEKSKEQKQAMNIAPAVPKKIERHYDGRPRIAIVIDDLGLSSQSTERAIALPLSVTLSFLPYGTHVASLADKARAAGHEILLHLPMEPLGQENPGPGALMVSQSSDEMRARFDKAYTSFSGFDGVNNHMGSKFTEDRAAMETVVKLFREKNLFFLDSRTGGKSIGADVAREAQVPTESRDVFLDDDTGLAAINAQLAKTELVAKRKGYAIAIGHPNASLMTALKSWIPEAENQGFDIVPVRELVK